MNARDLAIARGDSHDRCTVEDISASARRAGIAGARVMIGNASKSAVHRTPTSRAVRRIFRDDVPGAAWETDTDLRILHGLGRMGLVGEGARVQHEIERHQAALSGMRQVFQSKYDGRIYDCVIQPLYDAHGSVRGTSGVAIESACAGPIDATDRVLADMTETLRARRELEETIADLRSTLEATADGTIVVDASGAVVTYNQRFASLWGIPERLLEPGRVLQLVEFAAEQLVDPRTFLANMAGSPEAESVDVLRFKDGRVFERLTRPRKLGDQVTGRVCSFRDVTERELLLHRAVFLGDATRVLSSLDVDVALEAVVRLAVPLLGEECRIDLFGFGRPRRFSSENRDWTWTDPPEPSEALVAGRPQAYQSEHAAHLQVPIRRRGQTIGVIDCIARPGRMYGPRDIEIAEELGTRICLTIENAQLFKGASEALRAREEFIAVAAHEIRGPVTAMHLAVQLLRRGTLDPVSMSKAIEVIEREDRRLGRFVEELLDLGRSRTGGLHFVLEEVNLADVVNGVAQRLAVDLWRAGSELTLRLDEHAVGAWDRLRLEQVVTNLVTNAIKFGEHGPIEVEVTADDHAARLRVRDHGIGIPKDAQARVFAAFERAVPNKKYGGLGLGLYIVRTIVEGLGGTIRVESEPGQGTTFEVELPRKKSA